MDANAATLATGIITFLTLLVHSAMQIYNRHMDRKDKAVEKQATYEHRSELRTELRTNTDLTIVAAEKADAAYAEANDVNRKIAAMKPST